MSCSNPLQIYGPGWHSKSRTPVIDGKYIDPKTGDLRLTNEDDHTEEDHFEYSGPPCVDVIIKSQHADTAQCTLRVARPFPMETMLCHMTGVVGERGLKLDSLMATTYSIRVILLHELTPDEFYEVAWKMIL